MSAKIPTFIKKSYSYFLITLALIVLVNILVITYVQTEQAIYYWDISAYWKNALHLLETFQLDFQLGVTEVINSTSTDYNYLPLVPLLPAMELLGSGRKVFTLLIVNLYVIPFAVLLAAASTSLVKLKRSIAPAFYALALFATLFLPATLVPALDGRVDAINLVIVGLVALLYAKTKFAKYRHYFFLGILLCLMIVFRRYFSFWALGFFVSYTIVTVVHAWFKNHKKINKKFWSSLRRPALGLVTTGLTIVAIMLILFRDVFMRYLGENYADLYSAYYLGGAFDQVLLFIQNFGLIIIIPALIGYALAFTVYKKTNITWVSLFLLIQSAIIYIAFTRTQSFGVQHYYMLIPFLLWGFFVGIKYLLECKRSYLKYIGILMIVILFSSLSLFSFTGPRLQVTHIQTQMLVGLSENVRPIVRTDLAELQKIDAYLNAAMLPSDYVYTVSSSHAFNDDILRNINLPKAPNYNVSGSAHIDKRDGFPNYFFDAQYIIVATPTQTHVEVDGQEVITYLTSAITAGKAENLEPQSKFYIDNGITLTVYKKTSTYSPEFIKLIQTHFKNIYPGYPNLNNITYSGL